MTTESNPLDIPTSVEEAPSAANAKMNVKMNVNHQPLWKRVAGVQGLYLNTSTGVYHSRFRMNGKRTFRSLGTDLISVAKVKHAKRGVEVEKDRQRGVILGSDFSTLGPLFREMEKRLSETPAKGTTLINRKNNMARLRDHWIHGVFETFPTRNCTAQVIAEFRKHLATKAKWSYHFQRAKRVGFGADTINQTLWVLRVMLDIAVEKSVIVENPFAIPTPLREQLYLTSENRRGRPIKNIPEVRDMNRIFAEIRRLPTERFNPNPEQRAYLQKIADEMADHAELLAYSGMRLRESWASTIGDDHGDEFKIWGTKSPSSERTIQVNSALRAVLDRIKSRRVGDKTKLVITREPMKAMNRACDRLGLPHLTNHKLRHYFASVCIASGVDIPTVSRWLGHSDGGALAMATYGHLLKDHARAAARKVDFTGAALSDRRASQSSGG